MTDGLRTGHTYLYDRPEALAPLVIKNQLTNEVHLYETINDAIPQGLTFFDFNGWKPSIYDILNNTGTTLSVVLFSHTFDVQDGEWWRFIAHDEIETHQQEFIAAYNLTPLIAGSNVPPYWDPLLGGSYWDNFQSPWDGGRF